jgi:hypothetical protein
MSKGVTPVLLSEEASALLKGMKVSTVVGLRDRAIIAVMTYTFARVGAVVALSAEDYYSQKKRWWLRPHRRIPSGSACHHAQWRRRVRGECGPGQRLGDQHREPDGGDAGHSGGQYAGGRCHQPRRRERLRDQRRLELRVAHRHRHQYRNSHRADGDYPGERRRLLAKADGGAIVCAGGNPGPAADAFIEQRLMAMPRWGELEEPKIPCT